MSNVKKEIPLPDKKYNLIYADPPWQYSEGCFGDIKVKDRDFSKLPPMHENAYSTQLDHYSNMTDDELKELPVSNLIDKSSCVLFMWATAPKLYSAVEVMKSWGFQHRTIGFVWIKTKKDNKSLMYGGIHNYTMSNAELCLVGKPKNVKAPTRLALNIPQVIFHPRGKHSAKPNLVRQALTELYGTKINRIELFARGRVPGWDVWGDEAVE